MSLKKLDSYAPLEPITKAEEKLETKIKDVNSSKNSRKNPRKHVTFFQDENHY